MKRDPAYKGGQLITQGGGIEFVAIAIAILFAVATAMQNQYAFDLRHAERLPWRCFSGPPVPRLEATS